MTDPAAPPPVADDAREQDDRPTIRTVDAGLLLCAAASVTLWMALTDGMLRYVRPGMRPWLTLSGIFLLTIAALVFLAAWRDDRRRAPADRAVAHHPDRDDDDDGGSVDTPGHRHRLGYVGWLLAAPLVVAVAVDPSALGAYAIRHQSNAAYLAPGDFDLADHIESHSFGGQAVDLQLHEFLAASYDLDQEDLLAGTPIRLEGFVVGQDDDPGRFLLARMLIGCCAGDAVGLTVEVDGWEGPVPAEETWVRVTGHLDPVATRASPVDSFTGNRTPVFHATGLEQIDPPDEPYEYPR